MSEPYFIPRTLDDPPLFFLWNFDEAALFLIWAILGAVMGAMTFLLGAMVGYLFARGYARMKEQGGRGLLFRVLFWYVPSDWWITTRTPSDVREYIGG